jgi:hypothetical protein
MLNFVDEMQTQIIIFISGTGSNAREIIRYFDENEAINVCGVVSLLRFSSHTFSAGSSLYLTKRKAYE